MKNIQIFDPSLCCSTGVCGPEVDQELVRFAADVAWAKASGIAIERVNLAQQPLEFANNPLVKGVLETSGEKGLPVVLVGGALRCSGRYPTRAELGEWAGKTSRSTPLSIPVVDAPASGVQKAGKSGSGCC